MAIQLLKENDRFNTYHQHFLIDGSDDLISLEANYKCQMGDVAEAVDGTKYIRHSDGYSGDLWEEAESSSGGGGSELPAVTAEDNGDVLTVIDGEWDKATLSIGTYSVWNEQLKDVAFVTFEAVSNHAIDVSILCSDGYAICTWEASQDAESGDWTYQWGEWINGDDPNAIPNLENYTTTLEWNIGLILEAAFADRHDWSVSENLPSPGIVCRTNQAYQ